jgi:ABC-type glycerol-3-phosphate transport system substrate-binding protein
LRYGKIAVFFTAALLVLSLVAAGCGTSADSGVETNGKPVVINFWQPG